MAVSLLCFIILSLFMIHEFDEIIFTRPWIEQNQTDKRYQKELFIARKESYPSAESLAFMIAEEFVLAVLLLLVSIVTQSFELALATGFAHTLHLFGHIAQVLKFKRWVPGGLTAVATLPILLIVFSVYMFQYPVAWPLLLTLSVVIMIFLVTNLLFLQKQVRNFQRFIYWMTKAEK